MTCQACGTENEEGRKFCKACGTPLALLCGNCGGANTPDARFCGECGNELVSTPAASPQTVAPAPPTPPATERRLVSVLFVDLVGSTSLAEGRDAEEVRDLLGRYFDLARDAIERHGGLVEKFIGDAVMAVWGTPVAHEDDAERAVRAALEVVDAVQVLGREVGVALAARAGVLTGEAAATVGAVHQGIVAGDLVNAASRIQSSAEPGWVLVGESTYRSANRAVTFEEVGELTLKGKEETVRAWRALRVVSDVGGANRSAGLEPPFVGRSEELRALKESLHATEREGKARLVSITGMSGLGKSRLAWELEKYIDGLKGVIYWHTGRCPAYGDAISFWALAEMVRMRARIAETDDPATARAKLTESVTSLARDDEERRWLEPRMAHLLGLEDREAGEREELFSAWRTYFERVASLGPTTMVFEDIQWADAGLLDFIESILEWSRNSPILIVTLSRPELIDRRPNWGVGQRSFQSLHLEPLEPTTMTDLVRGFVRGMPDEGVTSVVERAEGVPLYAVEMVRMLVDRGSLKAADDAYEVVGDLGKLEVPESLQALIAARLDGLSTEERTLLQDAAVLGKSFTLEALTAVSGLTQEAVEPLLRDLSRKEFLQFEADQRSPERGQYQFVQSLIREVAYGQLAKPERRKRHLATAHHLESLGEDTLAGAVAAHYAEAYQSTPAGPEADALAARARDWLGQAADRALSLGSPDQALGFVDQALEITPSGAERAALLQVGAHAAGLAAHPELHRRYFADAQQAYRELEDPIGLARTVATSSRFTLVNEEMVAALDSSIDSLAALPDREALIVLAMLHQARGAVARAMNDRETAIVHLDKALKIAEAHDDREMIGALLVIRAGVLDGMGRRVESEMLLDGAQRLGEELGDPRIRAAVLAIRSTQLGKSTGELYRDTLEAVEFNRRIGDHHRATSGQLNMLEFAVDLGEWATADAILAELDGRGGVGGQFDDVIRLCRALLTAYRGNIGGAMDLVRESEHLLKSEERDALTSFLRVRSVIHLLDGDLDDAIADATRGIEADPTGLNTPMAIMCLMHAGLWSHDAGTVRLALERLTAIRAGWNEPLRIGGEAGIAAIEGRLDDASTGFRAAIDGWATNELPLDQAMTVIDAVETLGPDGVDPADVQWARSFLGRLGAAPLLARLERNASVPQPATT